ncbi:MAG TPA: hypothetical protein VGF76_15595 [Polyangiaceae bacterium]
MHSVAPEAELDALALTPEQSARRKRLRRGVSGVILGLLAFTALAAVLYLVRSHERALVIASAAAEPAVRAAAEQLLANASQLESVPAAPTPDSAADAARALATTPAPVATGASRKTSTHSGAAHPSSLRTRPARPSSRKLPAVNR